MKVFLDIFSMVFTSVLTFVICYRPVTILSDKGSNFLSWVTLFVSAIAAMAVGLALENGISLFFKNRNTADELNDAT